MSLFDEIAPQNTPESEDPFISALTRGVTAASENTMEMGSSSGGNQPPAPAAGPNQQHHHGLLMPDNGTTQIFDNWSQSDTTHMMDEHGFSGTDRTLMWQQSNYMTNANPYSAPITESGFISGETTQNPSMSGHDEDLEGNYIGGSDSLGGSTAGGMYNLDSLPQSENSSVHSVAPTDPSVFIPEFINGLQDGHQDDRDHFLRYIDKFTTKELVLDAIIRSEELMHILVNIMNKVSHELVTTDPESNREEFGKIHIRAQSVSKIMRKVSNSQDGKRAIVMIGGVSGLTAFLRSPMDSVMFNAITALHNLLLDQREPTIYERAKSSIRSSGGPEAMTKMLQRDDQDKLRTIVVDCLRLLAMKHTETKLTILANNGPQMLVDIMRYKDYDNLLHRTAKLLKVLSVCPRNKDVIIKSGGISAIAKGLTNKSDKVMSSCIWALRNLSDAAGTTKIDNLPILVQTLVRLLGHPENQIAVCAAGILFNFTCNNAEMKLAVCNANGIKALSAAANTRGDNKDLCEPTMGTLKHITNNHPSVIEAQRVFIQECDGLSLLMKVLTHHMQILPNPHWPTIKEVMGLLKNISSKPQNQQPLRDQGVVATLKKLLVFVAENHLFKNTPPVENIRPEEIVEIACGCLFPISSDQMNRPLLRDRHLIQVLGKLLMPPQGPLGSSHPDVEKKRKRTFDNMQKYSIRSLHELSFDPIIASGINQDRLIDVIKGLVTSPNEDIAKFACGTMQNLSSIPRESVEHQNMTPTSTNHGQMQSVMQNQPISSHGDMFGNNRFPMQQGQQCQQHQQPQHSNPSMQFQQRRPPPNPSMMQRPNFDSGMMGHHPRFGGPAPMDQAADLLDMSDLMSPDGGSNQGGYPPISQGAMGFQQGSGGQFFDDQAMS